MVFLRLITPPAIEPVTLEETKLYLRISGNEEDSLISALITVARQKAEEYTRRAFITQTWELSLDSVTGMVYLPRPPVQMVESVVVDGKEIAASSYTLIGVEALQFEEPFFSAKPSGVVIRYRAGYGDNANDVPMMIRQAILILVAYLYEHRGDDEMSEFPEPFKGLLRPYRVVQV